VFLCVLELEAQGVNWLAARTYTHPEVRRLLREVVFWILGVFGVGLDRLGLVLVVQTLNQGRVGFVDQACLRLQRVMEKSPLQSRRWSSFRALRILVREVGGQEQIRFSMESFLYREFPPAKNAYAILGMEFSHEEQLPDTASRYSRVVLERPGSSTDFYLAKANAWSVLGEASPSGDERLTAVHDALAVGG
jgi:hypothetical protein